MSSVRESAKKLAELTADYRVADGHNQSEEHVLEWVSQFDASIQLRLLDTLNYSLQKTYFSQEKVLKFIDMVATSDEFTGGDHKAFWNSSTLLEIQKSGNSQKEMNALLLSRIRKHHGKLSLSGNKTFIYLDDAIFSGNRAKSDLIAWIENHCPETANIRIVNIAQHSYGQWVVERDITSTIKRTGKKVKVEFWRDIEFENGPARHSTSDVLWPSKVPMDENVRAYLASLPHPDRVIMRTTGAESANCVFENEECRAFIEEQLLIGGVKTRIACPHLNDYQRPLGNIIWSSFGFGSLFVSFRNCPNNAPIALWAGDPWKPLFPRKTNADTAFERFVESL